MTEDAHKQQIVRKGGYIAVRMSANKPDSVRRTQALCYDAGANRVTKGKKGETPTSFEANHLRQCEGEGNGNQEPLAPHCHLLSGTAVSLGHC